MGSVTKKSRKKKADISKDISSIGIPFGLFTGLSLVLEELTAKSFEYSGIELDRTLLFNSDTRGEYITIYISDDNLLIRQFDEKEKKVRVVYVVKDSDRKFQLV